MEGNVPWHNPRLGMPFGADWRDFPVNMNLELLFVKISSIFTASPGLVVNLVWLLGIIGAAVTATYCLQRLGVQRWISIAIGILYGIQPFGIFRQIFHLNLLFYLVPLIVTGAIELILGRIGQPEASGVNEPPPRGLGPRTGFRGIPIYLWLACPAQGLCYIYNSFFSCFLLITASILACVIRRRAKPLRTGLLLIGLILIPTAISLTPSVLYWAKEGQNPAMAYKYASDAEKYGLNVRYLLTPTFHNPFWPLHAVERRMDRELTVIDNENMYSKLGTVGSIGFLMLIFVALVACCGAAKRVFASGGVLGACSGLNLACLLLGTIGGFGAMFAAFISPEIRGYNRIVVFIDFFSLVAVSLLLTRVFTWWSARRWPRLIFAVFLGIMTVMAVADQADTTEFLDYQGRSQVFSEDAAAVKAAEAVLPGNASIFQLPFTTFPAETPLGRMSIYDHARAYLHSNRYRWSWGAMTGRADGEWCRKTAALPAPEMVAQLVHNGFSGIWLDTFGYNPGESPAAALTALTGSSPLPLRGGRILFYDLRPYINGQVQAATPEMEAARQAAIHPAVVSFSTGFYTEEHNATQTWHWAGQQGVLTITNPLPHERTIRLATTIQSARPTPENVTISSPAFSQNFVVHSNYAPFTHDFSLPSNGQIAIAFQCKCKPLNSPARDPRSLYFALVNTEISEVDHAVASSVTPQPGNGQKQSQKRSSRSTK